MDRGGRPMTSFVRDLPGQNRALTGNGAEHWRRLPFLRSVPCHFDRRFLAQQVSVVIAHPDDETIGCGALLTRTSAVPVILLTDGAPRNLGDAARLGFASAADYAQARRAELRKVLEIAEIPDNRLIALGLADQTAADRMADLARRLADVFTSHNTHIVLTHAYEGGHPDHDAAALAVQLAAELLAARGHDLSVFEMPFYRLGEDGTLYQSFVPGGAEPIVIPLGPDEQERKRQMMQSFTSQSKVLAPFTLEFERFRPAPTLEQFERLPNDGRLLYERQDWGMTGERWQALASEAIAEIARESAR
jgi:N-acetylglucosamine malate deacetylase 2